jgi:hypothetical protein
VKVKGCSAGQSSVASENGLPARPRVPKTCACSWASAASLRASTTAGGSRIDALVETGQRFDGLVAVVRVEEATWPRIERGSNRASATEGEPGCSTSPE